MTKEEEIEIHEELCMLRREARFKEERKDFLKINFIKIHMRMENILEHAKDFKELKEGMSLQVKMIEDLAYMPDQIPHS